MTKKNATRSGPADRASFAYSNLISYANREKRERWPFSSFRYVLFSLVDVVATFSTVLRCHHRLCCRCCWCCCWTSIPRFCSSSLQRCRFIIWIIFCCAIRNFKISIFFLYHLVLIYNAFLAHILYSGDYTKRAFFIFWRKTINYWPTYSALNSWLLLLLLPQPLRLLEFFCMWCDGWF